MNGWLWIGWMIRWTVHSLVNSYHWWGVDPQIRSFGPGNLLCATLPSARNAYAARINWNCRISITTSVHFWSPWWYKLFPVSQLLSRNSSGGCCFLLQMHWKLHGLLRHLAGLLGHGAPGGNGLEFFFLHEEKLGADEGSNASGDSSTAADHHSVLVVTFVSRIAAFLLFHRHL